MRLQKTLFQLTVLLLPTQLNHNFFLESSSVFALKIDYLAYSLYFTDLLIITLFGLWLFQKNKQKFELKKKYSLIIIMILIIVNIYFAVSQATATLSYLELVPEIMFGTYVFKNKKNVKKWLAKPLVISLMFISALAITQFVRSQSIGGALYFFGERDFNIATPGIAKLNLFGITKLRPYATLPHPNALAGYLLAGLILVITLSKKTNKALFVLVAVGLLLSFSKSAFLAASIAVTAKKSVLLKREWLGALIVLTIILSMTFPIFSNYLLNYQKTNIPDSLTKRLPQYRESVNLIAQKPLLGVGYGNFILGLASSTKTKNYSYIYISPIELYQPAHNVFLLIFSETGIIGLLLATFFLMKVRNDKYIYLILIILITSLLDHYWVTAKQTRLLLVLIMALSLGETTAKIKFTKNESNNQLRRWLKG